MNANMEKKCIETIERKWEKKKRKHWIVWAQQQQQHQHTQTRSHQIRAIFSYYVFIYNSLILIIFNRIRLVML